MKAFLFSFCYNILYTVGWLVTLPSYLLKQKRRGGFGTGLLERFGLYRVSYNREPKGVLYVHAVSVGEVVLALKFLRAWLRERGGSAVLATSTATGHATAVSAQIPGVRVIYAPFDLLGLPGWCFDRFEPEAIVLVEAELWPNFARAAKVRGIPMAMINARMSARSESRYRAFKWISKYYFSFLDAMGVQDKGDVRRFESVGVRSSIIHVTGSIKFDQQMAERRETNAEFASILDKLKRGKPVVLAASTHDGEEVLIAEAARKAGGFPLIVPMYNTAGCIARCVKSICAQTYKSIEILLLNDGSTDDTLAVCRALAASDHRIALVDKTNTGAADTRNQGIALAHGKYIQFVDSDDWLAPDFTEKLVSAAEAHTADLVIAPFWMVYPENYVEHIRPWEKALQHVLQRNPPRTQAYGYLPAGVYTGQEYAKHLIQKPNTFYYGSPCNKLYRRDLLRKHSLHFRKELFAEDQLFNTEYLRFVRTAVSIPDIGYYYLQNSQSVSHSRVTTADILRLRRRVMLLYRDIYTELGIYPETRAAILRSPFGENEFTLPPLDTPQTHCCKL